MKITLLCSLIATTGFACAATTVYHGSFVMSESSLNSSQIAIGDVFHYEFTVDGSVADTDASVSYAQFPNLLSNFSMVRDPANTGTWDPQSGTFSLFSSAYADNRELRFIARGDNMTALATTGMMPEDPTEYRTDVTFNPYFYLQPNDTGAGQTFDQSIGTINPTSLTPYFFAGDQMLGTQSLSFEAGPLSVPEPTAFGLAVIGSMLALTHRRR